MRHPILFAIPVALLVLVCTPGPPAAASEPEVSRGLSRLVSTARRSDYRLLRRTGVVGSASGRLWGSEILLPAPGVYFLAVASDEDSGSLAVGVIGSGARVLGHSVLRVQGGVTFRVRQAGKVRLIVVPERLSDRHRVVRFAIGLFRR